MVSSQWPRQLRALLLKIEPYHTAILNLFMVHAGKHAGLASVGPIISYPIVTSHACLLLGAKGRLVLGAKGRLECPPDYRLHRYYMRKCLVEAKGTFKDGEGELKAQTMECLGIYDPKDYMHKVISKFFKPPPGAK